ncbi:MAG: glycosyltransferase family 39 protein [Saprospiraceae bacterium]|nr:glycosyltransferase family 39 protein [Saprospiraceae bacterium]
MTSHALISRWLPVLYLALLWLLAAACSFNGLHGADTQAYLQQFRELHHSVSPGMLQGFSMLSATWCCLVFERLLQCLAHGSRAESRWIFTGLGVSIAPLFLYAGLTVSGDAPWLLLLLLCLYFGFQSLEKKKARLMPLAVLFGSLAMVSRHAYAALLIPYLFWLMLHAWQKKRWETIIWSAIALLPGFLLYKWLQPIILSGPWESWSAQHFFHRTFTQNGQTLEYTLPNILYVLFPLAHPGFLLHLPLLFLLAKKTDVVLPEKKILLISTCIYLLFLGGLPFQEIGHLLPVYLMWLLVLFPAWDRMYCYGLIFFRKITLGVIGFTLAVQVACTVWLFWSHPGT